METVVEIVAGPEGGKPLLKFRLPFAFGMGAAFRSGDPPWVGEPCVVDGLAAHVLRDVVRWSCVALFGRLSGNERLA